MLGDPGPLASSRGAFVSIASYRMEGKEVDAQTAERNNTKFRDSTVPVLCLESALFDDFRLAGPTQGTDYGTAAGQTELELLAVSHPLAVGLTVPITSAARTFSWAVPAAGAIPIARVVGSSDRMGIFAFEAGQPLTTGVAPARRVGWVATGNVPTTLTKQGWQLFDDAVNWTALAPVTIDSFAGLPNAAGDKLKSSFFLTPCLSVEAHACVTVGDKPSNRGFDG